LGPTIISSPPVNARMTKSGLDNVLEKEFTGGSKIYLSYAKDNPDRARGISADELKMDEVQDIVLTLVEPVLRESLFTSPHKRVWWSGTPKSFANGLEQRVWRQSDQREWMVRCHHHGPLPLHQKLTIKNMGKTGPVCSKCGRTLNTLDGTWVITSTRTDDGKTPRIHGYHIPQIIFPTMTTEVQPGKFGFLDWEQFVEDVESCEEEAIILNEKFGESADSSEKPITEEELRATCAPPPRNMIMEYEDWMKGTATYAGVDWGTGSKSATVLAIGQFVPNDPKLFHYVFLKKYEKKDANPETCVPDILRLMEKFRVHRGHGDWGSGLGLNSRIVDARGDEFWTANYWSSNIKGKQLKFNVDINSYILNRSIHINRFFQALKRRQLRMAMDWDSFKPFARDILNVFKEYRKDDVPIFDHKPQEPDDSLHAMVYAWIIASIVRYGEEGIERIKGQEHFPYRT